MSIARIHTIVNWPPPPPSTHVQLTLECGREHFGDAVARWRCGGSLEMWWLIGNVVAHWKCGGSLEMWWLVGEVEAHF